MTINELLQGSVEFDLKLAAHTIYWAIRNGLVDGNDNVSKLHEIQLDNAEIEKLTNQNVLGIERIKLFVIRTSKEGLYAFYFAEDPLAASQLHQSLFGEQAGHITNGKRLWPKKMHFARQGYDMTFFDLRKQIIQYPAYLGHAYANQTTCYYLLKRGVTA